MDFANCWILVACPIVITILYFIGGNLIYLDGICATLTILGTILSTHTYIENFYVFEVQAIMYTIMYFILCFTNMNNLSFAIINFITFIINLGGIKHWLNLKKQISFEHENKK